MNLCFVASNIFALYPPLFLSSLPSSSPTPPSSFRCPSTSSSPSSSPSQLALALIFPSLSSRSILSCKSLKSPRANGCLKFLPVVTSLSLAFVPSATPPEGGEQGREGAQGDIYLLLAFLNISENLRAPVKHSTSI